MTVADVFHSLCTASAAICMSALFAGPAVASDGMPLQLSWIHNTTGKGSKISLPAADRRTVTTKYGAWQVTCNEAGDQSVCSASFKVIDRKRNATILTWMLGHNSDGVLLSEFFVPTEVMIRPGVSLTIDGGQSHKADYVACGRSACKASLPVNDDLAQELNGAGEVKIAITSTQGKVTEFAMGIDGIEAAMAALAP